MKTNPDIPDITLEELAALEHEQWAAWTRHFFARQTPSNIERWKRQAATAYANLPEEEKESDREWARKALDLVRPAQTQENGVLYESRFLTLRQTKGWEYVERRKSSGIVAVLAVTAEDNIILIEQYRPPVGCNVIEVPAGLAGDIAGAENEHFVEAAHRELFEEAGYRAEHMEELTAGPISAGLSTEIMTFYRATGLSKEGAGGGVDLEKIRVHEVPMRDVAAWLEDRRRQGMLVDCKVYSALFFARQCANS